MNRTRTVFFAVLATALLILAVSLAGQWLSARALMQLFIASAVFGIGVVLLDFFGVLGSHHGGDMDDGGLDFGHDGGDDFTIGHDAGHVPMAAHDSTADNGHASDGDGHAGHEQTGSAHAPSPAPILSVLVYLRLLVYFSLGFGPAGWVALASGFAPLVALLMAIPLGLFSLVAARAFFRFQRRDTGVIAPQAELLREEATVIIPLSHETMGKVRVRSGQSVSDLYALAADPGAEYHRGATVRIIAVDEEAVRVR